MNPKNDLTTGKELPKIIRFAIPMLIGNVFQQMYNMVDAFVVGNTPNGDLYLAAVGTSFPIVFLLIAIAMGIGMGGNILVAQYFGAGDKPKLKATIATQYIVMVIAGVAFTIVGFFASPWILRVLQTPENVLPHAITYIQIFFVGMLPMFGFNTISSILRGLGDSKTPTVFLIIATIINMILDAWFVWGFGWGVAGVAWATIIAQAVAFVCGFVYLAIKDHDVMVTRKELRLDKQILKDTVRIGLPSGIQQMVVSLGFLFLQGRINYFGSDVMSGFAAAMRVDGFAMMPLMNLGMAISAFVGQNIGAGKWERVTRGAKVTVIAGVAFSIFASIVIILLGRPLVAAFNQKPEVIAIGNDYLFYTCLFYFLGAYVFIMGGVLRGAGDATASAIISVAAFLGIRVPLAYALSMTSLGYIGILLAQPIGWVFSDLATFIYYRTGRWKTKAVVKQPPATPEPAIE